MVRLKHQCLAGGLCCFGLAAWKIRNILNTVDTVDGIGAIGVLFEKLDILDVLQLTGCMTVAVGLLDMYRLNPADCLPLSTLWLEYIKVKLWGNASRFARWRHERHTRNVNYYQEKILREIIDGAKETAYYKDMNLGEIKSSEQFREHHPLTDYTKIKAYVDRSLLLSKKCV